MVAIAVAAVLAAQSSGVKAASPEPTPARRNGLERYHYSITARVRPLVMFWITRRDVGDAVVSRSVTPGEARYSLLIGSDPDRAPLHINRWGYIEEDIRGVDARLVGLMTESDEESIQQAEANVRKGPGGGRAFKAIETTFDGQQARSHLTSFAAPEDYTFRQLSTVLGLAARRQSGDGTTRAVRLPPGARPGFLAALADAMHEPSLNRIVYAYYGRLYELRRMRMQSVTNLLIDQKTYGPAVTADFVIVSLHDGERTRFSMTYGRLGQFAEVPLKAVYQPRWWMQIELTIDDTGDGPAVTAGVTR